MLMGSSKSQHWFYLSGRDYLAYRPQRGDCTLLIKQEPNANTKHWLMGDPFLRAYYSIYDLESKKVGLAGVAETTRLRSE